MTESPLFLVHPGSACGSADFNIGRKGASAKRADLVETLLSWNGPVVVFDGELSDELDGTELGMSIEDSMSRNSVSYRVFADDGAEFNQVAASIEATRKLGLVPGSAISVTGAWIDSDNPESGCVTSVSAALEKAGFTPIVLDCALDVARVDGDDDEITPDQLDSAF